MKHNVMPLYFASSQSKPTEFCVFTILDMSHSKSSIEEVVKELESTGAVEGTKIIEPVADGLVIDNVSHPLTVGGDNTWSS